MRINYIEWKNIFAYGEDIQKVTYTDGELVLLQGVSGAGKSTILALPSLLLYGKIDKLKNSKSSIANRTNKNGWIKGEITKGQSTYIIERTFSPNSVTVWKNGDNIENYGSKDAQDYIDNEIVDLPLLAFNNMISISMKRFKSFLTMSTPDRKQIIDRVFNLEVINIAYEKIKKDARELGALINNNNTALFQLQQTQNQAIQELKKIQENSLTDEMKAELEANIKQIEEAQEKIKKLSDIYNQESQKQQACNTSIYQLKQQQFEVNSEIRSINDKIDLFSQDKCPTCGTSFSSNTFTELKNKLNSLKEEKNNINISIDKKMQECAQALSIVQDNLNKIQTANVQLTQKVNELTVRNSIIQGQSQQTAECAGIQSIINTTTEQINAIKNTLAEDTAKLGDLQKLTLVFSIDGVKQQVINNYIPRLNQEIAANLELVNFPYSIEIDSKFEPHLKELNMEVQAETLSDGEETRVDIVILCSLFKLLKLRYPSINILFIDEVISSLGVEDSGAVLNFLNAFAKDNHLCVFVVSHTNLYLDNFDKIINVEKNGFSHINVTIPNA